MLNKHLHNHILIICFLIIGKVSASDTIVVYDSKKTLDISSSLLLFEDKTNHMTFDDVKEQNFIITDKKVPNLGISNSTLWAKIFIKNSTSSNTLLLDLSLPTLDFVEFYSPIQNNEYDVIEMGEHLPFGYRKYNDPDYIFDILISKGQVKTYYLKISSKEGIQLPIIISSKESIFNQIKNKSILFGLYFGIMLVMIFYNLFIYFSIRDKNYLYYVVYVLFTFLTQASLQGYTFQFIWPNTPIIANYILFIVPALTGITGIIFMKVFLDVKSHSSLLNKLTYILCLPYLVSISFLIFKNFILSQVILELNSMLISLFMLITPIIILRRGYKPAKFFLIAWSVFLIGIFIYVLKDLELLPFNNFTRYTMPIGSAIETILLSFALADRINILKKEKEQSQLTALLALQENETLIIEQNVVLENKVEERTIELKHTNDELNTTLSNLKNAQTQLVSVEKMASLGQLTAGIAHEINNPINFVSANLKPLKMDIADILELVKKYEALKPNEMTTLQFNEIEEFRKEIDIDYLKKEMTTLLSVIEDGAKRTTEIVVGLRNFSRLDEGDIKDVNVNDGIRSTLLLLKSAIPLGTEVIVNLGDIPKIECFPGKLNQVFMNVFANALYAIGKKESQENNKLSIKTYELNNQIYISMEDTGIGMKDEVKAKIFEPFYTTKPIGEGTGLGMSIVLQILESHHAKLEIESEYGVGTKMVLILNKRLNLGTTLLN